MPAARFALHEAVISPSTAAILSESCPCGAMRLHLQIAYVLAYVIPFYLSKSTRPSPTTQRSAPAVIQARVRAVSFSSALTSSATFYLLLQHAQLDAAQALRLLGWWPVLPADVLRALALVALLFAGPLFEAGVVHRRWRAWASPRRWLHARSCWPCYRNYVAGPLTEEVTFRSALVPLHVLARASPARIVFTTPLYFGIAHVHHLYEFVLSSPRTPLLPAVLRALFQFAYTSLFGFFAAFVYLRTGSLLACVLVHAFCNWMGLPRFWGRLEAAVYAEREAADGSRTEDQGATIGYVRVGLGWSVAYYGLLVLGATGFYRNLWTLTESRYALMDI